MGRRVRWETVPWLPLGLVSAVAVVLVIVASTRWNSRESFPDALLTAIGLLLTALVFLLGLAQNRMHRTCDAVLDEARRSDETILRAHLEHPLAVGTMDLWEVAAEMREALHDDVDGPPDRRERRRVLHAVRAGVSPWGLPGRLDRAADLYRITRELERDPGEGRSPSARRRAHLERERTRIVAQDEEHVRAAQQAGITVYGYRQLRARVRVAVYVVRSLVSLTRAFGLLMVALVALGAIYAGWRTPTDAVEPEAWAASVLIALAWVYSHVVVRDLALEQRSTDTALSGAVLVRLSEAEAGLGWYWGALEARGEREGDLRALVQFQIEDVLRRAPQVPWLTSIRGRLHLLQALDAARSIMVGPFAVESHNDRQRQELRISLRAARRLLGHGSPRDDDPIALLAVSRLWAFLAEVVERDLLPGPLPGGGGAEQVAEWRDSSSAAAERAVDVMSDLPLLPATLFGQPHARWLREQTYLWPDDGPLRDRLVALIGIDTVP